MADTLEAELRVAAKRTVDGARARLERLDVTVQSAVLRGRPASAIRLFGAGERRRRRGPWWTGFPEAGSPELMHIYHEAADASRSQHDQLARDVTTELQGAGLRAEADRRGG